MVYTPVRAEFDSPGPQRHDSCRPSEESLIQAKFYESFRRPPWRPFHKIHRFDDFNLDARTRQLRRAGEVVTLQPKAIDLLLVLVESRGRLLTKDELLNLVWPDQVVEESNLTVTVSALRKALGERRGEHRFVVTEPGRGYRTVADVSDVELKSEPIEVSQGTDDGIVAVDQSLSGRQFVRVASRVGYVRLLCALLLTVAFAYGTTGTRTEPATTAPAPDTSMTIKRLTTTGRVSTATLSPDGRFFAYISSRERRAVQPLAQSRRWKQQRSTATAGGSHRICRHVRARRQESVLLSNR